MNFKEAVESLQKGNRVRRNNWPEMFYLQLCLEDKPTIKTHRQECISFQYDNSIILSGDWLIIGEEEKEVFGDDGIAIGLEPNYLNFGEALEALQQHKKIRLKEWPEFTYIQADDFNTHLFMRRMVEYPFIPLYQDFIAQDWEVV